MITSVNTPRKQPQQDETNKISITNLSVSDLSVTEQQPSTSRTGSTSTPISQNQTQKHETVCNCNLSKEIGPRPAPISGHKWVPAWTLQKDQGNKSFEELVLDRIKGPQEKIPKKT